jgi:hypothetical protein
LRERSLRLTTASRVKQVPLLSALPYLKDKFGDDLKAVRSAMQNLARAYRPQELAHDAYPLYERFRPAIPASKKGWGAKGDLDLGRIGRLAKEQVEAKPKQQATRRKKGAT